MTLDEIAARYDPADPGHFDHYLTRLHIACIAPWLHGARVLELGSATGQSTALLAPYCGTLDVVEGSATNADKTRGRVPDANVIHSMWEHFHPDRQYTDVVCTLGLEHVDDPERLLSLAVEWLLPGGRLHVIVPNGLSLHRLVGVEMGMLTNPLELTDGDRAQGHRRNYTPHLLKQQLAALNIVHTQPVFLKVVPSCELVGWTWERIEAVHEVAQAFPDHGAELYIVGER